MFNQGKPGMAPIPRLSRQLVTRMVPVSQYGTAWNWQWLWPCNEHKHLLTMPGISWQLLLHMLLLLLLLLLQVTVNNQIVIGTLMNICDDPNHVSIGAGWREGDHIRRVPIIVTGGCRLGGGVILDWKPSQMHSGSANLTRSGATGTPHAGQQVTPAPNTCLLVNTRVCCCCCCCRPRPGNDFSTLYAPLIRDGRMEKFYWQPDTADIVNIVHQVRGLC